MKNFDVCVIGAGPGGYVSAIRCAKNGLSVACVEKQDVGGVCLNWGCIPTKALLHSAELINATRECEKYGAKVDLSGIDINKIVSHSRDVVKKLTSGVEMLFKKNKISLFRGYGRFINKNTLEIEYPDKTKEKITAKYFVIATGATPRLLDGYDVDEKTICTYRGAMVPTSIPKQVVIIGGGVIGVEFATFYNSIGCNVSILERSDDILMMEDCEIRDRVKKAYSLKGIDIHVGVENIKSLKKEKSKSAVVDIQYEENGKQFVIHADKVILAVGVVPNINNIGIEKIGVKVAGNGIQTDEFCKTNVDNVFAIGDITATPWLAHKASKEGVIVADYIAFLERKTDNKAGLIKKPIPMNKNNIPSCIYTFPQIASIGLTEDEVKKQNIKYKVGKFFAVGNGKSLASDQLDNFVKVLTNFNTGELLGAHIIGDNATEIIHAFAIGKTAELLPEDFENTIFSHPTVSEMIPEAFLDLDNMSIHK